MTDDSMRLAARAGGLRLVIIFTATTFLSALLLFSVQPLFAKMVLPVLGGSTSVWAVAMCFFQGALLAGYCYAHLVNRFVPARIAGLVHIGVCAVALLFMPIGLPASWGEPPPGDPYFWQLGLFTVALGLPFLAVAANAPLLQAWFAATGHPDGRDPYFLYAASNLGSLIALLAYPFVLEPALGVSMLSRVWTGGFVLLIAAIGVCFWALLSTAPGNKPTAIDAEGSDSDAPAWSRRLGWVGLAMVPSALLTAYTAHVTTDVASAPLLWVLPLAIYLLTFVLVFRERALIPMRALLVLQLAAAVVALLQLSQTKHDTWFISAATGIAVFFLSAMLAHRRLYESRPAPRYLTEFYLWMSLGGVLGGLFSALIAPRLFSEVFEYPLLVALTIACRPGALSFRRSDTDEGLRLFIIAALGGLALFWVPWLLNVAASSGSETISLLFGWLNNQADKWGLAALLSLAFTLAVVAAYAHPRRQLVLALLMFATIITLPSSVKRGSAERSYFGVYRVSPSSDGEFNVLTHGTTLHGAQRIRNSAGEAVTDTTPTTYYHPKSPMAKTIEIVRAALAAENKLGQYGVIGLGSGSLSCYAQDGETWRFFEIDPTIVGIATNPEKFSFLANCQPKPDIVLGDARLTMAKQPNESFDLIIVDAFTSDAVPVHLMTAEALRMFATKLTPTGVVLLHISNRYLDLDAVLGATAPVVPEVDGLILSDNDSDGSYASTTSTVAVFSKSQDSLEPFRQLPEAQEFEQSELRGWTDDFSDILGPFLARMRQ